MSRWLEYLFLFNFVFVNSDNNYIGNEEVHQSSDINRFVFWPNASIPFYINSDHFDHEQSISIMTALANFAFKTCLKFAPVLVPPQRNQHVMVFENPHGVHQCLFINVGHPVDEVHNVTVGYDCLKSPEIDMIIMRALGFFFEHNRAIRDLYIDVQNENIQHGAIALFAKEPALPSELRMMPYDIHSVMHFEDRDYSKNGHRTIIFKDRNTQQKRVGLTNLDLRKIELVYGRECKTRDRQEQIELCQSYPGFRRKRETDHLSNVREKREAEYRSLRVNPEITAPPSNESTSDQIVTEPSALQMSEELSNNLNELGIQSEVQNLLDSIYKVSSLALQNARRKYCNDSNVSEIRRSGAGDVLGVLEVVAKFAKTIVDNAAANVTSFCLSAKSIKRAGCPYYGYNGLPCPPSIHSTNYGPARWSTQHRPWIKQSTKHDSRQRTRPYDNPYYRANNNTEGELRVEEGQVETVEKSEAEKDVLRLRTTSGDVRLYAKNGYRRRESSRTSKRQSSKSIHNEYIGKDISSERDGASDYKDEIDERKKDRYNYNKRHRKRDKNNNYGNNDRNNYKGREKYKNRYTNTDGDGVAYRENSKSRNKKRNRQRNEKKGFLNQQLEDDENSNKETKDSNIPKTVPLSKLNEEFYSQRRWPDGVVRYIIESEHPAHSEYGKVDIPDIRKRLEDVNTILKERTCTKIEEITEEEAKSYEDYLVLNCSPDYITGRVGGRQQFGVVDLLHGGQHRQHAAMMVMAMLGFYFEITRHDRDSYIVVHNRHIRPDKLHHFERIREDATLDVPYDYKSATHPSWPFWRKLNHTGIATVATYKENDPDGSIMRSLGQHTELLSEIDIIKINSVYGINCFKDAARYEHGWYVKEPGAELRKGEMDDIEQAK